MEERELTQLLQRAGDRVAPGPAPVAAIVREGRALQRRDQQQRHRRILLVRAAAVAAVVVGGGSLAATVVDLPSLGGADSAESAAGGANEGSSFDAGAESAPEAAEDSDGVLENDEEALAGAARATALPSDVAPGDRVVVRAPGRSSYSLVWLLERRTPDGWVPEYRLAAALLDREPTWWRSDEAYSVPDVGGVEGPVELVIPEDAVPGDYRVCEEEPAGEPVCAPVVVGG